MVLKSVRKSTHLFFLTCISYPLCYNIAVKIKKNNNILFFPTKLQRITTVNNSLTGHELLHRQTMNLSDTSNGVLSQIDLREAHRISF